VPRRPTDALLRPRAGRYLESLRPPRDSVAAAIERRAAARGALLSSPEVARLLEALAASTPAGRILELGTGLGYGTLHLARGAREGRVVSVERDPEIQAEARAALAEAGVAARVELLLAPAFEALTTLAGPFDLVVLDADPLEARRMLDLALPLLPVGGRLVVLRALAAGVPGARGEEAGPALRAALQLHPYLLIHPQLASVLLPLGDGVGFAVKRRVTMRELGGPY
jgi:predicted O-methyltransferase YrrM